jgi:acyl-coenzyme A synthetase/AMP-(fatty) acid ligase
VGLVVRESSLAATPVGAEVLLDAGLFEPSKLPAPRVACADASGRPWRLALSSGTTGVPKAVAVSHAALDTSAWLYGGVPQARGGRRHLLFLDLNAAVSMNMALRRLVSGDPVVLVPGVSPDRFFDAVDRYGIDASRISPHMLGLLADHAPGGALRCPGLTLTVTGGALPAALRERAARLVTDRILVSYGSTETGSLALVDAEQRARRPDAAGLLLPWAQAQAVDDAHRPLPPGETGRLRFRGPEVATGYVDDPRADQASFRDGWFYPGDLGSLAADGMLLLAGRTDEILDAGGRKVNANEVDAALLEHPDVAEAAAFVALTPAGRPLLIGAVVSRGAFDAAALLAHARSRLGPAAPDRVVAVSSLPRNESGKVLRSRLAAAARIGAGAR